MIIRLIQRFCSVCLCSQNPCVATQTLYLDVLVSVVQHICEQEKFDGITEQDQLKLVQEVESNPKEPSLLPNDFITRARLLLLLTRCVDESKRRFSMNVIYCKCLEVCNQAVRLFALEHINIKELRLPVSDFETICPIVVSLLRDETSEDVLAQVGCVCMLLLCSSSYCTQLPVSVINYLHFSQTYTFLASAVETIGSKCLRYRDSGSEGDHMQVSTFCELTKLSSALFAYIICTYCGIVHADLEIINTPLVPCNEKFSGAHLGFSAAQPSGAKPGFSMALSGFCMARPSTTI